MTHLREYFSESFDTHWHSFPTYANVLLQILKSHVNFTIIINDQYIMDVYIMILYNNFFKKEQKEKAKSKNMD